MSAVPEEARVDVLSRVALFGGLAAPELVEIADLFVELSYQSGDTVCRAEEAGDRFFVVVSGALEVWGGADGGRVINRLGPADVLGEMSLLAGGPRAATVTAARPTRLLALEKADFDRHLLPNPKVLEAFSRLLSQRLATMARGEVVARATTVVGVTADRGLGGKSFVASALGMLLAEESRRPVLMVRAIEGDNVRPRPLPIGDLRRAPLERITGNLVEDGSALRLLPVRLTEPDDGTCLDGLGALVTKLGARFPFVVLDLGTEPEPIAHAVEEISDVLVRVVDAPREGATSPERGRRRTFELIHLGNPGSRPVALNHCEPFVIPDDPDLRGLDAAELARRLGPSSRVGRPLRRLARKIMGTTVGLAMGGGAAFGIAHVGVLKVLEDNGIPVDLIAGSSMGSIIAVGYAAGLRPDEMIEMAGRLGTKWTTLSAVLDFSITKPGLLTGDRLVRIFGPLAGTVQTFEQLALPCRAVATDVETGERVAIGTGRLDVAFRASSAVPMLWAPVRIGDRVLVDGGVSDPVPAEVVREMGADVCIAVNAVPALRKGVDTVLSRLYRQLSRLNPLAYLGENRGMPSMFDVVMNSMQTLQYELGNFKAISADVRINPDLSGHTWIEFYRPEELIARGAEAAERALPSIRRVLEERVRKLVQGATRRNGD